MIYPEALCRNICERILIRKGVGLPEETPKRQVAPEIIGCITPEIVQEECSECRSNKDRVGMPIHVTHR